MVAATQVAILVHGKNTVRQICHLPKSESNTEILIGLAQQYCAGELDAGSMYRARDALLFTRRCRRRRRARLLKTRCGPKRRRVETIDGLSLASPSFEEQLGAHCWPLRTDHTGKISLTSAVQCERTLSSLENAYMPDHRHEHQHPQKHHLDGSHHF